MRTCHDETATYCVRCNFHLLPYVGRRMAADATCPHGADVRDCDRGACDEGGR